MYPCSHYMGGQVVYLLGRASTSYLGLLGALVEIVVIVYPPLSLYILVVPSHTFLVVFAMTTSSYIQCASVVGMYSTPPLHHFLPSPHNTPLTHIIANCVMLLMLSSALPLTAKTLGKSPGSHVTL